MGCIHRHEIIKSDISYPLSQEDIFKQSLKEEIIPKNNSLKIQDNNIKSNNLFYANSNNSGSNVTSNNKNNNYQNKDNTFNSLLSNDYFNNKYNLIGELNYQQNIEEFKIQLKSNLLIYRCMRKISKNSSKQQNMEEEDNSVLEEANLLKKMIHKHICQLYECIITPHSYFLIMDYCKEGNLEKKIRSSIKYNENQIKYLAFQLFEAIQYLNNNNYMHTDIKPSNILIDEIIKNVKNEDLFIIKLLNFGSYGENYEYINNINNVLPYYSAPEILDNIFDATSDVWSIGVIIYQMLYGEVPFGGENINEVTSNIKNEKIALTSNISSNLKELLELIFEKDCKKRINAKKCLEHNWFYVGNRTLRNSEDFKNYIVEEINTDTKIINIVENSKNSESNKNEENNSQNLESNINEEKNSKISESNKNEIKYNDNKINEEHFKKRISNKNKVNLKLNKLSIPNPKRISKPILLGYGKNQKNNKIPPLIKYIILYIKFYIRIYFQKDKEINKLNNIYLKYKLENNIHLFINYINNTKKISFDYFYYNQNKIFDKNFSKDIKEQINNKEELFKILIENKKNYIETNLKKSFDRLRKSSVEEIKNIFKEGNSINIYEIQKFKIYFNEMEFEMEKNKYKQIYLYADFYKILINAINKLYSQFLSNNISTNVDSNNTNKSMLGINNKSKESIKNENSKENNDKIIFEQINGNKEEEKVSPIEIIKDPEKNKEKNKENNNKNNNIINKIKKEMKDINIENVNINLNKNKKDNNKNNVDIKNYDKNKIVKENKNEKITINKNKRNSLRNDENKSNNLNKNKNDNINNNIIIEEDDDYETEERKKDKNRFDPEKFLSIISFP